MTSPRIHPATSGARKRAFTLVEMLVVLGIAAVVIPILLVSTSLLSQGFGEKQALNQINAALALARATAIRDGRDAALLFTADAEGNTLLHIATLARDSIFADGTVNGQQQIPRFRSADDRAPGRLGSGIRVVALNADGNYVGPQLNPSQASGTISFGVDNLGGRGVALVHFAVRFRPDGTIVTRTQTGQTASFWFDHDDDFPARQPEGDNSGTTPDDDQFVDDPAFHPVDILALYDKAQAEAYGVAGNQNALREWINDPSRNEGRAVVILFNRYTGLALRAVN